tara:strand:+ start:513 stop:2015 length:1503 start_codon:yes stop_codon:yes gene_type:complete
MFGVRLLFYPLFIVFGIIIGIYLAKDIQPEPKTELKENKLDQIINTIDNYYVKDLDKSEIENRIINAMLSELDPHSSYQTKVENQAFEENMKGSFSGIGIEFKIIDDTINVLAVIEGGPCSKIGLKAGDRIISVDGEIVCNIDITNQEVVKLLKGEKNSEVEIEVKRDAIKENISFEIIRNNVPIKSVETSLMIDDNIGYIKVVRFSETTYKEISEKYSQLLEKGMTKLILDLRNNRGGYMHIATRICDDFLKERELIVYTKDKDGKEKKRFAKKGGMLEETKLAVIINENSASASEIIAGAIQDNDRGIIIGRRSFGKGLVQTPFTLDDGSIIKLTTHKYYTPSGRSIQKDYQNSKEDYFLENETDTTKYLTKKENIVYGGGGITPNVIVNRQINEDVERFLKVWITDFCFKYAQKNKQKDYKHFDELDKINLYNDFNSYVTRKEDKLILNLNKKESKYLRNLILATVSRYLFNIDSYYKIINNQDEFVKAAVLELSNE